MAALAQLVRYVYLVTDGMHFERLRDMIRAEAPKAARAVMTIAERLRREGHKAGLEEGREAGRVEGLLEGERRFRGGLLEDKFISEFRFIYVGEY